MRDASAVMARLEQRGDELVHLFSKLRDRTPLLTATASRFPQAGFDTLALLEPQLLDAVFGFYDVLEGLTWYLSYTEAMPSQLKTALEHEVRVLKQRHLVLVRALGRVT